MGLLKDFVSGLGKDKKVLKAKFKEADQDFRVNQMVEERQKSANQRELEKYMKEKREEQIKVALDKIRKEKTQEIFTSKYSVLKSEYDILKTERPILKEKNIFKDNPHIFMPKRVSK